MKKTIIGIIIGIVVGTISTVVASSYIASNIAYTPKDSTWKVDNVEDAIDELYTKDNNISLEAASQVYSSGIAVSNRNVTKELTKGKYVVSTAYGLSAAWDAGTNTFNEIHLQPTCSHESDCKLQPLKTVSITQKATSSNSYLNIIHGMYQVDVLSDTTVLTYNANYGKTIDSQASIVNMEISKIK